MFTLTSQDRHGVGINRNIVECKYRAYVSKSPQSIVLIETLWNVNLKLADFKTIRTLY